MEKVLIIAEAGVNHNGEISLAKELIHAAIESGADIVKFQNFNTSNLVTKKAKKANYQLKNSPLENSQYEMLKKLELSSDSFQELESYATKLNIEFLSTAFDIESIKFLKKLNLKRYKVPSGEITNFPYLREIAHSQKPIIMSTGMATIKEIENAIKVLQRFGALKENLSILHCTSDYPAAFGDLNLKAIQTLKSKFSLEVGYSDHSLGIEVPIAAVSLGARIIEKHLTLNQKMIGPDHLASIEPQSFKEMVKNIRNIEIALGNENKIPTMNELKNKQLVRKSIVASVNIREGEVFNEQNITSKRPGIGICPMQWETVLGKVAKKSFYKDQIIEL